MIQIVKCPPSKPIAWKWNPPEKWKKIDKRRKNTGNLVKAYLPKMIGVSQIQKTFADISGYLRTLTHFFYFHEWPRSFADFRKSSCILTDLRQRGLSRIRPLFNEDFHVWSPGKQRTSESINAILRLILWSLYSMEAFDDKEHHYKSILHHRKWRDQILCAN